MREILFRGKRTDNGEWVEGIPIITHIGTFIVLEENPHYCWQYGYMEIDELAKVNPDTVGQYTGLTDLHGVRIYEGDVVKVTDDYGETDFSDGGVGDVGFYDGLWYVSGEVNNGLNDLTKVYYVEVIGKIHDNPELLEG